MKTNISPSLIAIALAAPLATMPILATSAQGQVRDFQLRPSPTPTATPQVQGPIDTEGPVPIRPRVITTPTPTPSAAATPAPTTTQTPAPASAPTSAATNAPTPRATRTAAPRPQAQPQIQPQRQAQPQTTNTPDIVTPEPSDILPDGADALQSGTPAQLPTQAAPVEAQSKLNEGADAGGANYLVWIGALAGLLLLIGGAFALLRRRKAAAAESPEIESPAKWVSQSKEADHLPPLKPTAKDERAEAPAESVEPPLIAAMGAQSDSKPALQVKAQALTLSRSLMNATLSYRLELMNLNNQPISEISVKADVVTAHGKAPVSEQVADETTELLESAFVASIEGRATHETKGTFSMPVGSIRPITQRGATLYVPLLRLRIDAAGMDPIICTFVVGVKPPERGAKLQPFRLDEMAQTYRNIGLRLLD